LNISQKNKNGFSHLRMNVDFLGNQKLKVLFFLCDLCTTNVQIL